MVGRDQGQRERGKIKKKEKKKGRRRDPAAPTLGRTLILLGSVGDSV
jgi:hypothetical protein